MQNDKRMIPPSRSLPRRLVRAAELTCVAGVALSAALAAAGLWMANDIGVKMVLAGVAGVLLFLFVPVWIIGSYDAVRAGQHASGADLARAEFGATWGPTAYFAHVLSRTKHRAEEHDTPTPDDNEVQRTSDKLPARR